MLGKIRMISIRDLFLLKNEKILVLLLLLLCLIPTIIFIHDSVMDPYFTSQLSATVISENNQALVNEPYEGADASLQKQVNEIADRTGLTALILILHQLTGLSYGSLAFLPVGGIIIPFMVYLFCRMLFSLRKYAIAITIFISFNPLTFAPAYSINRHAWGYILLFTFLIIFWLFLKSNNDMKKILSALLVLIFITTISMYYATEFMLFSFIVIFAFLSIFEFKRSQKKKIIVMIAIIIILPIFILFLDPWGISMVNYIPTALSNFFANLNLGINRFFIGKETYPHQLTIDNPIISLSVLSSLFLILVISLPTFLFLYGYLKRKVLNLWKHIAKKSNIFKPTSSKDIFFISLAIMAVLETLIYLFFDQIIFRSIWVIFPVVASAYILHFKASKINWKKIIGIFLGILVIGAIVRFPLAYSEMGFKDSSFILTDGGTFYIAKYAPEGAIVLTSQKISGKLLVNTGLEEKDIVAEMYFVKFRVTDNISKNNVYFLYSDSPKEAEDIFHSKGYEYLILTKWDMDVSIVDGQGRGLEPIGEYDEILGSSVHFNLLYDDFNLKIYKYNEITL